MQFHNRTILITGAASGIGRSLALQMARAGAQLALLDCNENGLRPLEETLKAEGHRCSIAVADVRRRTEVHRAVDALTAELGPFDIAVASAGIGGLSLVDDLRVEQLEAIVQVNFLGVVYTIEAVLPAMLRRHQGQIVGIASLAAFRGLPFESGYCASKAALASYLESLRPALRRRGVRVTTVFPGFVHTPLLHNLLAGSGARAPWGTLDAESAAQRVAAAIVREQRVCCFPTSTSWLMRTAGYLPPLVYDWVMTRIAKRIPLPY
jgi:short-subunit dehydrogenase